jgi:hypothetical protein
MASLMEECKPETIIRLIKTWTAGDGNEKTFLSNLPNWIENQLIDKMAL